VKLQRSLHDVKNVGVFDRTPHEIGARTDGINRHVFTGVSFGAEWYGCFLEVGGVSGTRRNDTPQTDEGIYAGDRKSTRLNSSHRL